MSTKYVGIRLPNKIYENIHNEAEKTGIPIAVLCRSAAIQVFGNGSAPCEVVNNGKN